MEKKNEMHTGNSPILNFDPFVLLLDVVKRWLVILTAALMVGVGAYILTDSTYSPSYQTNITFVVTSRSSSSSVYTNLTTTNSLASVFSELLNSSLLRKSILAEIGESSFDGTISSSVISGTNLLTVSVTSSNPRTAFLVAQAIIDHHEEVTYQVVDSITLEVLQYPAVPTAPTNRANAMGTAKKAAMLTAAAVCALLAVFFYSRNTIRNSTEARQKLNCSYLGEIPHEQKYKTILSILRRRKTGILISLPITGFRFVENIRKLRYRIEQRMHDGKVLMVTSLLENEGKSTVSVNLALAMAQKHSKVLLIDCDLRKPACHILLGQKTLKYGLKDVLNGKCDVASAVNQYQDSNLYMLLDRHTSGNTGALVGSDNMKSLLDWARKEFDFVVLDLPPMAAAIDAERVMEIADASLLVIRQNVAATADLNKAIATLDSGKARLIGCVLNNVYSFSTLRSYDYGRNYGYGRRSGYGSYGYKSRK